MLTRSEKYTKYIKEHPDQLTLEQTLYEFPNGYGANVIYGEYTFGLEVAVIKWNENDNTWDIDYSTPVTNDVISRVEDLDAVLEEIYNL